MRLKKNDPVSFAVIALRKMSLKWPARYQALVQSRRGRNEYLCAKCDTIFGNKEVHVDHKEPVVPLTGWDNFDGFINRLYCPVDKLQVLCKKCHKEKSLGENDERRRNKVQKNGPKCARTRKDRPNRKGN